jgi:uracil-DNA glycosylase family 4
VEAGAGSEAVTLALPPLSANYDPRAHSAQCDRCPLVGKTVVPPQHVAKPKLIVIGEGPGRHEERLLTPFVGPSGKMLNAAFLEAGGHRQDCHITNAILCRNEDDKSLEAAIPCCAPRLAAELSALPKDIPILSLGAQASRVTIGKSGIQKYRGFVWHAPPIRPTQLRAAERLWQKRIEKKRPPKDVRKALDSFELLKARSQIAGRVVIPTVHPAFILRGADVFLPVMRLDIKRAVRWSRKPFPIEGEGKFDQTSNPKVAARLLRKLGKTVTVDIETDSADPMRAKITCVGVCDVEAVDKCVILDPWKKTLAPILRRALARRTCITHNGPAFDVIVLLERYNNIHFGKNEDTLVAHRSFASHMPQSLAHVASIFCETTPWKLKFKSTEEKGAVAGFGVKKEDLAAYNAFDVRLDALAWRRMQPELEKERAVYEQDMAMAALYTSMQRTGILVDVARQAALSRKLRFRAAGLVGEMRSLLDRRGFSPSKPNDIRKALYGQLKAPLWLAPPTPTGLPSTAALVLEALRGADTRAGRLADLIIRWRSANDSRSEYLDGVYVHTDGRVHPSWGQVETGRPRTRQPNILNIPVLAFCNGCGVKLLDGVVHSATCRKKDEPQPEDQLRDIYIAAKGHHFVYFDLQRAEMNFASHISGDQVFIASCAKDIHTENACILFPDGAEMIRADPKGKGFKFRQIAKICGFAVCYLAEVVTIYNTLRRSGFDVSLDDCETMLDNLKTSYRAYYRYVEENIELCRRRGYLRLPFSGRVRWFGYYPKPNPIANTPVQGGVADVMNERLLLLEKRKTRNAKLLVYHYDAAIYEVRNRECADMERIVRDVWAEPIVVPHNGISFVQKIDQKQGDRLSDF